MKKFLLGFVSLAAIASVTPAFGWAGGPWGNDSPDQTSGAGTYQASISGTNLLGVVFFGVGTTTESAGRFAVFHEGSVHMGVVSAVVDVPSRSVNGVLLGIAALPGDTDSASVSIESDGSSVTQDQDLTLRTGAEGAFDANIKTQFPTLIFGGDGLLTTIASPVVLTSTLDIDTDGDGVDDETINTFSRVSTPFQIRGSRTSINPPLFISSINGASFSFGIAP
jgi:hypothetical protein